MGLAQFNLRQSLEQQTAAAATALSEKETAEARCAALATSLQQLAQRCEGHEAQIGAMVRRQAETEASRSALKLLVDRYEMRFSAMAWFGASLDREIDEAAEQPESPWRYAQE